MTEGDWTMGGEHTIQHTGNVLYNCTSATYVINQCNSNEFYKNIFKNKYFGEIIK